MDSFLCGMAPIPHFMWNGTNSPIPIILCGMAPITNYYQLLPIITNYYQLLCGMAPITPNYPFMWNGTNYPQLPQLPFEIPGYPAHYLLI